MLKLWDRPNCFVQQESGMFAGKKEVKLLFPATKILLLSLKKTKFYVKIRALFVRIVAK